MFVETENFRAIVSSVEAFREARGLVFGSGFMVIGGVPGYDFVEDQTALFVYGQLVPYRTFNDKGELSAPWKPLEDELYQAVVLRCIRERNLLS